jgi:hypothetical protein
MDTYSECLFEIYCAALDHAIYVKHSYQDYKYWEAKLNAILFRYAMSPL